MSQELIVVRELHEAIRLKRDLERAGATPDKQVVEQIRDITRYIELLSNWGNGVEDQVSVGGVEEEGQAHQLVTVFWETGSDLWRAVTRNLNKDGVFLQTSQITPMGETIIVEVNIHHPPVSFRVPAKVIWVNPHERSGRPMGMGLKFLWRKDGDRGVFRSFMRGDELVTSLSALG